jgi:hypothetical protein
LPLVPVELSIQAVEGVVPLPGTTLQILPPTGKAREDGGQEKHRRRRNKGKKTTKPGEKSLTWKTRHVGPPWIRSASFSAGFSKAPWSWNSCHNTYSAWALAK